MIVEKRAKEKGIGRKGSGKGSNRKRPLVGKRHKENKNRK
jgi:hypothetical protein